MRAKKFIFILSILALFSSCRKEGGEKVLTEAADENLPANLKTLDEQTLKFVEGKSVAVVLGYGFNSAETAGKIKKELDSLFGVETEDEKGLVSVFVFPDDFERGRISALPKLIEDKELLGMLVFGAPEKTHSTLAAIMGDDATSLPYPVFSFFPQDDILGMQYVSNFVLDYIGNATLEEATGENDSEQNHSIPNFDAGKVAERAIDAIIERKGPIPKDSNLISAVQKILGPEHSVSQYSDPETKLQCINHFTFE